MKLLKWILKACLAFALMYVGLKTKPSQPLDNDESTKKKSAFMRVLK